VARHGVARRGAHGLISGGGALSLCGFQRNGCVATRMTTLDFPCQRYEGSETGLVQATGMGGLSRGQSASISRRYSLSCAQVRSINPLSDLI
jgi:hypothetical protein